MFLSSSFLKRTVCTPEIALTTVDLPWATWPMVPVERGGCGVERVSEKEGERGRGSERARAVAGGESPSISCLPSAHNSSANFPSPMLIVAWREMTSGDSGVSFVTSSVARSCCWEEVLKRRARRRRVSLINPSESVEGKSRERKSKRPRSFPFDFLSSGDARERIRAVAWATCLPRGARAMEKRRRQKPERTGNGLCSIGVVVGRHRHHQPSTTTERLSSRLSRGSFPVSTWSRCLPAHAGLHRAWPWLQKEKEEEKPLGGVIEDETDKTIDRTSRVERAPLFCSPSFWSFSPGADRRRRDGRARGCLSLSLVSAKREKTEQAGGLLEGESLSKKKKSEKSRGPKEKVSGKAVGRLCSKLRNSTRL